MAETVSVKCQERVWRVTFDGHILGDSRGYATKAEAWAEAKRIVDQEHAWAKRDGRETELVLRPC